MARRLVWAALALVTALAAAPTALAGQHNRHDFDLRVLSSPPEMVTGGDALVRLKVPRNVPLHKARVFVNGKDVTSTLDPDYSARTLTGLVTGLHLGANSVVAESNGHGHGRPKAHLTLVNHPVTGPIFSGPQQQPFVCKTQTQGLGFPKVDNQVGTGMRLFQTPGNPATPLIGWSKDCTVDTVVDFQYRTTGGQFRPLPPGPLPADIATTTTLDGKTVPYVVRRERGTINRFIYAISILSPPGDADRAARHLALERPRDLRVRRRRRDRPQPGHDRREPPLRPGPLQGLRDHPLERDAHLDALQPRPRRRDGDHDQGALHRGLRRPDLHRRRRRLRRRDPAVRLRAAQPGRDHRRGDPAVLVPRHGHADDPRRRLRAPRAVHGRHGRREPEVGGLAEPDVARRA